MGPVIVWFEETKESIRACENIDEDKKAEIRNMWNDFEVEVFKISSGSTLKSSDPIDDAFGARMLQLYQQYNSSGWYILRPLSTANSYFEYYEYANLCNLADYLGSPLEYTIVMMKDNNSNSSVGPLLTTKWHQGPPFNSLIPNNYPAGCVAVAMAQIMKSIQHPNSFFWNNMPDYDYSTNSSHSTPAFMKNVGAAVNMSYGSSGSGAYIADAEKAFKNPFSYNTVTRSNHNLNTVRSWLSSIGFPIFMAGFKTSNLFGLLLSDGHAWVCDGYNSQNYKKNYFIEFINPYSYTYSTQGYYTPSNPGTTIGGEYLYFHMNWGWDSSSSPDGWFLNNTLPNYANYQYGRENIYVKP
jgi:hypothetical protein